MKPDTFEDAYARIQAATRTRTQTEIANLLGIKQSSISDAKKKNTIPDGCSSLCTAPAAWNRIGYSTARSRSPGGKALP